jgi:hypothetical protein
MDRFVPMQVNGRRLAPHKASASPLLGSRNVLTKEPWTFVSLWLKRNGSEDALFYWEQALEFQAASVGLPLRSAPLPLYYCYMNAAKALLSSKGMQFNPYHGVTSHQVKVSKRMSIANEGVRIKADGVLPSLSSYYGESEAQRTYSLQELFFNMPFIHRTFCLTYKNQTDMFLPIRECVYVVDTRERRAFFKAELSRDWASKHALNRLPPSLSRATEIGPYTIRSVNAVACSRPRKPSTANLKEIADLHKTLRGDVFYINGTETLWYVKGVSEILCVSR